MGATTAHGFIMIGDQQLTQWLYLYVLAKEHIGMLSPSFGLAAWPVVRLA